MSLYDINYWFLATAFGGMAAGLALLAVSFVLVLISAAASYANQFIRYLLKS